MFLPQRFGGHGIPIFSESTQQEYEFSTIQSKYLTKNIINQQPQFAADNNAKKIKSKIKLTKMQHYNEELQRLRSSLSNEENRVNELNGEQRASSWLTTIPLLEEGYDLTKHLFWDLIRIRYGWTLTRLPSNCECGSKFDIQQALCCKKGGFVSLRHNHIINITLMLLKKVCKDVRVELQLPQLAVEYLQNSTAGVNKVRLDISARVFWQAGKMAFLDVRVFNPNAK